MDHGLLLESAALWEGMDGCLSRPSQTPSGAETDSILIPDQLKGAENLKSAVSTWATEAHTHQIFYISSLTYMSNIIVHGIC